MRSSLGRFFDWITSFRASDHRKGSFSSTAPSSSSTSSNFSCYETQAREWDKLTTSSNTKKVVRFAEENDGEIRPKILNDTEHEVQKEIPHLDESLEEVYEKEGLITGFIKVNNLERGRQVLVRYTDDNWRGFKQVKTRRVERFTDPKGVKQIRFVKEKKGRLKRSRKRVNPSIDSSINRHDLTYLFKIAVDKTKLNQVELVVISRVGNEVDTHHQQCYSFKSSRRSWEASESPVVRQWNANRSSTSRQS